MLVLGRKSGESIRIGEGIEITVVGVSGNRVRIGIQAPDAVRVRRSELDDRPQPPRNSLHSSELESHSLPDHQSNSTRNVA